MSTRERVLELRSEGLSLTAIARALGLNKSTVAYHVRRLGEPPDPKFNRRYDWPEIQRFYDAGHTVRECLEQFGCSSKTFADACKRGVMKTRGRAMPIEQLLSGKRNRLNLKLRLLRAELMTNACYECGISEWRGRPLSLALHHVNGDGYDNRLENLQLLCPNCHSQTDNFAGRNRGARAVAAAPEPAGAGPSAPVIELFLAADPERADGSAG